MNDLERFLNIAKVQLDFFDKMINSQKVIIGYLNNAETYLNKSKEIFNSNPQEYKSYVMEIKKLTNKIVEAKSKIEK